LLIKRDNKNTTLYSDVALSDFSASLTFCQHYNVIYMAFLLNYQAQGVSGKNE